MVRRLNKYWSQAVREEAGFTLVEQIVTLVIVTMVLTAAMAALATGSLGLNVTTSRNEAMNLAQAQMECIKNQDFVDPPDAANYVGTGDGLCHPGDTHGPEPHTHITKPSGYSLVTDVSVPPEYPGDQAQRIEVTVVRGSNEVLVLEDLKVDRP